MKLAAMQKDSSVSKYNSLRTGLRTQAVLLPWESEQEYQQLRHELIDHHNPVGPTELHLVDEIASVIWRSQRVKMAEASLYRRELADDVGIHANEKVIKAAVIGKAPSYLQLGSVALAETVGPAEDMASLAQASKDLGKLTPLIDKIAAAKDYEAAVKMLGNPDAVAYFEREWLGEEGTDDDGNEIVFTKSPAHLAMYLDNEVVPELQKKSMQHRYAQDIANQLQGQAFNPEKLELIGRYETQLDRKLERMLAMLLKTQELRSNVRA